MSDIVYIFGAGINQSVTDWNSLSPPLALNLFKLALKHPRTGNEHYIEILVPVFDYIMRYWKLSADDLSSQDFDLEACFTLLELQSEEALSKDNRDTFITLAEITYRLTSLLAEYLSKFESFTSTSESFSLLGQIIYDQKPAIITFNYDTLLESSIGSASGVNLSFHPHRSDAEEIKDDELLYSHLNWNRPLAYGVKFDEVQLHRAGLSTFVSGGRFYGHKENNLYTPPLLKLHGSINWFEYSGVQRYSTGDDSVAINQKGKTVIYSGNWWFNEAPDLNGIIMKPIIITPIIYKPIWQKTIISSIWQMALNELSDCKRLIVGGYSFPPTDFHTRRLFLEAFSEHSPEEIIVINPDTRIVQIVKDLCHFRKPVLVCRDLDEFVHLN